MTVRETEVVVVGAGVAGLNAAAALAGAGAKVTLLERRPYVGGRAYSYLHPALDEVVDSQHVLLGCCTNLIDFCEQAGVGDRIRWYDEQTFLEPGTGGHPAQASTIRLGGLPAPLHYAGSFLGAKMLDLPAKLGIARGLTGLMRCRPERDEENVAEWYRRTGQTEQAVRNFWDPIVYATLNDGPEQTSMRYAGKVFQEIFLKTRAGGRLGIPTVPLSEFYAAGAKLAERHGARVELRAGVEEMRQVEGGGWSLRCADAEFRARQVVLALPFEQTERLVRGMELHPAKAEGERARAELVGKFAEFRHSPFISILLWFDREITELDHAWLLGTTVEWFFHKSRIRGYDPKAGSYVELVIAGAAEELRRSREELLRPALEELGRFFPKVKQARLVKSGVLKEARATFSVLPGLEGRRPGQETGIDGLYLAGDWTRTDWPSTMEGAARSGRLAAGAVCGTRERFLLPELEPEGLMRWVARG